MGKLCLCGCGNPVRKNNRFIHGHNSNGNLNPMYGRPSPGKGKVRSLETRQKISKAKIGKQLSIEHRAKLSASHKKFYENGGVNWFKGKALSVEHRAKLKAAHEGKPSPKKGIPVSQKNGARLRMLRLGTKLSKEHKAKISNALSGKRKSDVHRTNIGRAKTGENNPFWKGGVCSENEKLKKSLLFKLWRESVFFRDDFTCQGCGKRGGKLHPHHVKEFSLYLELRFDVSNGKTLCVECHKNTPNYGWKIKNAA